MFWGKLRARVTESAGWRRRGIAWAAGGMAALALPPVHALPLLVVGFTVLAWLIDDGRRPRGAFADGWWFGFGYFTVGLYWISLALLVEPEKFAWLIPFALVGIGGGMAFFPAAAVLAARLTPTAGPGRILALATWWTVLEWVRGWAFTGFPWNLVATVWTISDSMIQAASAIGVFGLGWVTVAAAAMPAAAFATEKLGRQAAVAGFCVIALMWAGGAYRLSGADDAVVEGVRLRLVQPNIDQRLKWHPDHRHKHIFTQMKMSRESAPPGAGDPPPPPTHVIWGETMVPFHLNREPILMGLLAKAVPEGGVLLTGTLRASPRGAETPRSWNSILAVDHEGRLAGYYDKFHLVPFGEYIPFRPLLGILGLERITHGRGDFDAGPGPATLRLPGLPPVSPLICYEVLFPG